MTTVLGIDPGSRITGFGIVQAAASHVTYLDSGCIDVRKLTMLERLRDIYAGVEQLIAAHGIDEFAIEDVFVAKNPQSALKLGQARGVALAAAARHDLVTAEYSARQVKQAVVGTGSATKEQVQYMVARLLNLAALPSPDSADALAIAMCHCRSRHSTGSPTQLGAS